MRLNAKKAAQVLREKYVNVPMNLAEELATRFVEEIEGGEVTADFIREYLKENGLWIDWWDHEFPEFHVFRKDLPKVLEERHLSSEQELDDDLWYSAGVSLVVDEDPVVEEPISVLSIEDVEHAGFDTRFMTNSQFKELASRLGSDYCDQLFWQSLKIIAEEVLHLPKKKEEDYD